VCVCVCCCTVVGDAEMWSYSWLQRW